MAAITRRSILLYGSEISRSGGARLHRRPRSLDCPYRSTSAAISSSWCAAERLIRSRDVPAGTVGGRIAGTKKPCSRSRPARLTARSGAPSSTGTIEPAVGPTVNPAPASSRQARARARAPVRASRARTGRSPAPPAPPPRRRGAAPSNRRASAHGWSANRQEPATRRQSRRASRAPSRGYLP